MVRKLIKNVPFLYKTALRIKHTKWLKETKKGLKNYLDNSTATKLQLGAGTNVLPGWFNTDYFARPTVFFLDVTKTFPFPDNIFEWAFSEHHIEHISYQDAQVMLSETYRVMKPGGYIKIITPDLHKYIQSYGDRTLQSPVIKQHVTDWIYGGFYNASTYIPVNDYYDAHFINDIFLNYEHRFIYDEQSLKILLEKAGFINVLCNNAITLVHPELENIESHSSQFDMMFNLTVQAQKP